MFKKLSIRGRLLAGFGLAILLSALMIVLSLAEVQDAHRRFMNLMDGPIETVDDVKNARLYINAMARTVRDMALNPDSSTYSSSEADIAENKKDIAKLTSKIMAGTYGKNSYVKEWVDSITEWQYAADEIIMTIKSGNRTRAMEMIVNECTPALREMAKKAILVTDTLSNIRSEELQRVNSYIRRITLTIFIMMLFEVIILVLITIRIIASILSPLDEMKKTMIAMSKGDLHTTCAYEGDDEVGVTAAALCSSQQTLSNIISDLGTALEQMAAGNFQVSLNTEFPGDLSNIKNSVEHLLDRLNEVMSQLRSSGTQVASGADQVSSGAQALAQGATEQASSVEELSATINEISTASKKNAQTAVDVRNLANDAGSAIEKSGQQMQEMLSAMNDISNSSSEISKIIKTIEDIAFQTNILALNAAVEAARAGTAGKGFAVVADEVRNLASKSAEASKNTAALIEQAIHAVERGSALATGTADALNEASAKARDVVTNIDYITDAVDQEAASIEQITIGIDQISAVVQTNSATSEESAAASEELSSQAQMMHTLLNRFQLDGGSSMGGFSTPAAPAQSQYRSNFDSYDDYTPSATNFDKY